ncbi:MAG TPA: hypothetical protein VH044_15925 [Polyangiaceae bacterium]|jgi:hypothetical protein|nr:hypothetical protein [Polyangiaceae bacterium]
MRLRSAVVPAACRPLSLAFALSLGLSVLSFGPQAFAQSDSDRATARALGQEGQQAFENKDYPTAEDRFRRADKMVHAPTLMLGLARALTAEGKFVEAQESYNRIIREGLPAGAPDVFKRALDDAKKEVETVAPKVAAVTITVKAAGGADIPEPQVVLDEHPINSASLGVRRAIDPGAHVLRATAEGYKAGELRFSVTEGGAVDEPLTLEKDLSAPAVATTVAPAPTATPGAAPADVGSQPSSTRKMLPWIAFGVGGAGLVLGAVTGGLALGKHSTLSNECTGGSCPPSAHDDLSSYHTMGILSDVGFIVAGVGVAAGFVLFFTEPKSTPTTGVTVTPSIGLGSLGASGTF